ncbi:MAG: RtcB family protein [Bacteroidales bacterium]|nr:RtcB family protein [Bacteroidales bacterium]
MKNKFEIIVDDHTLKFFLTEKMKRSVNIDQGIQTLRSLMQNVKTTGPIALLPDYTPANSLPVGTCFLIDQEQRINPSWIGMDIGCGYNFFSIDLQSKKIFKNGKINHHRLEKIVAEIDRVITGRSVKSYPRINSAIRDLQISADKYFGTLGQGNHFIDLFIINKIYDQEAAERSNLDPDKIYFLIHTGSRELGFKIHNYYAEKYLEKNDTKQFNLKYLKGLKIAKEYASANRTYLSKKIGEALDSEITSIFDNDHNGIDQIDDGSDKLYCVRKGATAIIGKELSVIPGNCVSEAYIVSAGRNISDSYGTVPHGTGRKYIRAQLFSKFARSKKIDQQFEGIKLNVNPKKMIEEIPAGYKPISDIISAVEEFGLGKKIARLKPLGVIVERK